MVEMPLWWWALVAIVCVPILSGFLYGEYSDRTGNDPLGAVDDGDNNE